jgi:chitodextrinase
LIRKHLFRLSVLCMALAGMALLPSCGSSGGGSCSVAPGVPSGLAASSTTSSGTTLNWSESLAGGNCSATYTIYQNGTSIATTTSTTYNVTGLSPTTQYNFTVAASDSFGSSPQSSAVNVTTLSGGTPAGAYTISIIGVDANGVSQSGPAATVAVMVN